MALPDEVLHPSPTGPALLDPVVLPAAMIPDPAQPCRACGSATRVRDGGGRKCCNPDCRGVLGP